MMIFSSLKPILHIVKVKWSMQSSNHCCFAVYIPRNDNGKRNIVPLYY